MTATQRQEEIEYSTDLIHSKGLHIKGIRVPIWVAKEWLLANKSFIQDGNVKYLQIKNLGLGVCEIRTRPVGCRNTYMVNEWENQF